jgi:hypothetical protein
MGTLARAELHFPAGRVGGEALPSRPDVGRRNTSRRLPWRYPCGAGVESPSFQVLRLPAVVGKPTRIALTDGRCAVNGLTDVPPAQPTLRSWPAVPAERGDYARPAAPVPFRYAPGLGAAIARCNGPRLRNDWRRTSCLSPHRHRQRQSRETRPHQSNSRRRSRWPSKAQSHFTRATSRQ